MDSRTMWNKGDSGFRTKSKWDDVFTAMYAMRIRSRVLEKQEAKDQRTMILIVLVICLLIAIVVGATKVWIQ
jgi:hypothetical protein